MSSLIGIAIVLFLSLFSCTYVGAAVDIPEYDEDCCKDDWLGNGVYCLQTSIETIPASLSSQTIDAVLLAFPKDPTIPAEDILPKGMEDKLQIFSICATVVCLISLAVLLREILLHFKVIVPNRGPSHRHKMFALELFRLVVTTADSYMLLPGAMDLAHAVGWNPTLSGILDQFDSPGSIIGSLIAFTLVALVAHKSQRRVLVFVVTINAGLEVLLANLMITPAVQRAHSILIAFIVIRLLTGLAAGIGMMQQIMLTSVSSPRENAMLGSLVWASLAIGGVIGPAIPSITTTFLPEGFKSNALVCNAVPFLITASLQALLAILMSFTVPTNLEQVSYVASPRDPRAHEAPQPEETQGQNRDILDYGADALDDRSRMWLVILGQLSGIISSMLLFYGLQALPVLLQREEHWTIQGLGPAVSCISLVSLLAMVACGSLRLLFGTGIDKGISVIGSAAGIAGGLLMFDNDFKVFLFNSVTGLQLIIGSSMAGAFNGVAGGFMAGYGFAYADENAWYSKEMMSLGIGISTPLAGLAVGPFARGMAVGPGRHFFAVVVVTFTTMLSAAFLIARFHLMKPKSLARHQDGPRKSTEKLDNHDNVESMESKTTSSTGKVGHHDNVE